MIVAKRLKGGVLRVRDTETKYFIDILKKSEEKRMLPTLLQVCGFSQDEVENFIKEIK